MPTAIEAVKDSAPCGGKDDERPAVPTIVDMDNAKAATHVAPDNAASKVSSMGRPLRAASQVAQNQRGENGKLGFYSLVARSRPTKRENDSEGGSAAPNKEMNVKKQAYTKKSRAKDQAKKGHTKSAKDQAKNDRTKKENDSEDESGVLNNGGRKRRAAAKRVRAACNKQIRIDEKVKRQAMRQAKKANAAKRKKYNKKEGTKNKKGNFPGRGRRLDSTKTSLDDNNHQDGPNMKRDMSFSEILRASLPHICLDGDTIAKLDASDYAVNHFLLKGSKLNEDLKGVFSEALFEAQTLNKNNDMVNAALFFGSYTITRIVGGTKVGNGHVLGSTKDYKGQSDAVGQSDAGIEEGDRCRGSLTSIIYEPRKKTEYDFDMLSKEYVDAVIKFLFDTKRFHALSDEEFPSMLEGRLFWSTMYYYHKQCDARTKPKTLLDIYNKVCNEREWNKTVGRQRKKRN